jgi:thymidine phosphorylase
MSTGAHAGHGHVLRLRRLGIDTYDEPVIYMAQDCPVCRAEGWQALARVEVMHGDRVIVASIHVVTDGLLAAEEASLSNAAWTMLDAVEGGTVRIAPSSPLYSLSSVRAKVYGDRLEEPAMRGIIRDVAAGRYSPVHLAAFVTACAGGRLDLDETVSLTRAMVDVGDRLTWPLSPIVDKHSVGGLPGNRTTMIVVPVLAALGFTMPKTSSRAITSPSGTADAMETMAPVALDLPAIRRVVDREGACIVWGGAVRLSPADDVIIRVERPLDLDSEGQLVASVLSKKIAAGSTDVVIDMPVGPTAKVRSVSAATALEARLLAVGQALGLRLVVERGDGTQPIGRGVGPALEARDVLAVLQRDLRAPADLRDRALSLAGAVIHLASGRSATESYGLALAALDDGRAWASFQAICDAQGGMRVPPTARFTSVITASRAGQVTAFDNRGLARVAKLTGAPKAAAAGLELHVRVGARVEAGQPLYTLHAEAPGELEYARTYAPDPGAIVSIAEGG